MKNLPNMTPVERAVSFALETCSAFIAKANDCWPSARLWILESVLLCCALDCVTVSPPQLSYGHTMLDSSVSRFVTFPIAACSHSFFGVTYLGESAVEFGSQFYWLHAIVNPICYKSSGRL